MTGSTGLPYLSACARRRPRAGVLPHGYHGQRRLLTRAAKGAPCRVNDLPVEPGKRLYQTSGDLVRGGEPPLGESGGTSGWAH